MLSGTPNLLSSPAVTPPGGVARNQLPQLSLSNPAGNAPATIDPMASRAATAVPPMPTAGSAMANDGHAMPAMSSGAQPASFLTTPEGTPLTPADSSMGRDVSPAGLAAGGPSTSPYATNVHPPGEASAASSLGSDEKFKQAEMRLGQLVRRTTCWKHGDRTTIAIGLCARWPLAGMRK